MVEAALFARNIALLQEINPVLAAQMQTWVPQAQLVPVGEDDWDISRHGVRLYGMGAKAYARAQIDTPNERIWQNVRIGDLTPAYSDRASKAFTRDLLDDLSAIGLDEPALMARPSSAQAYHVISLGLGLGLHLLPLQNKTRCHSLVVVETDLDCLFHSLHITDWQVLFDRLDHLAFVTTPQQGQAIADIQAAIIAAAPGLLDGTRLLLHYPSVDHAAIGNGFSADAEAVCRGLGFMDDDVRMVRNSFLNLKNPDITLWAQSAKPRHWPIMIVGSGPSLDGMIDDVRRNAPHALVVAAGTAVPVLLKHGIQPDFCTVLENTPLQYTSFRDYAETYPEQVRAITLLASTSADPRLTGLFDRSLLVMRSGLASTELFCPADSLIAHNISPTVTNMALSLFLASGYDDILLFGVDLGARQAQHHHAKDSPYIAGDMPFPTEAMTTTVRGNLGGNVTCHYVFNWARLAMEALLAATPFRAARVRNCSDGARIKGTQPCLAKKLMLAAPPTTKADAIADFLSGTVPYAHQDFVQAWNPQRLEQQITDLGQNLIDSLDVLGDFEPMASLSHALTTAPASVALHFLRGTLLIHLLLLHTVTNRLTPEERTRLLITATAQLRQKIDDYTRTLIEFIADLDAGRINGSWLRTPSGEISEW